MPRPSVEAERREQILSATRHVVASKGFKAMRIADVAKRSGISTGTIHYYFETKRELMYAAFEWNFQQSQERRAHLVESAEDPRERLRAFLASYLPEGDVVVESWHMWLELWAEGLHDADLQELNEQVYGVWRRTMAAIIRDGQDHGHFVDGDPVVLANGLVSMVDGLALQVLLGSRNMTLQHMRQACAGAVDLLLTDRA
jgi:AcrR family transcriptional regulator